MLVLYYLRYRRRQEETGGDVLKVEIDNPVEILMIYRTQFYTLSLDYGAKHDDTFVYSGWKRLAPYMQYFKSHYCLGIPAGFIGYNVKSRTIILTPPCIYLSSCLSSLYTFIPPVYPLCIYLYLLFILLVYIYTSCLSSLYISIPSVHPPCIYMSSCLSSWY